ncbi:MAG: hypothetical protein NC299_05035 [Lachnospiraceae bacterium]|nr:hypothetical protein [Ruminococcus sp.]MCM1274715.1 hypothetical protein [Lachnospiraceae bacterium]
MFKSLKTYERFRRVVSLIAPNRCPFCGEVLDTMDYWCGECYRYLPFARGIMPPPDNISEFYACCFYSGRARDAVLMLKYGGLVYPADAFALMLSEKLRDADVNADMLVPVPNGREGVLKRGFSSSELIAERLSMRIGIPTVNAVMAVANKREQKTLSADKRRINALHSFFLNKEIRVRGKRIMLIDEVSTTGSTLSAVGEILRKAGAADVSAAVFAKTPNCEHFAERKNYKIRKR